MVCALLRAVGTGSFFLRIPGTSCLATIVQSLRDEEDKPRLS